MSGPITEWDPSEYGWPAALADTTVPAAPRRGRRCRTLRQLQTLPRDQIMHILEEELDVLVKDMCKQLGIERYHTYDSRRSPSGYPDLTLAGRGGQMWRELKATKGVVSPDQQKWIGILRAGGGDADVWRPADYLSGRIARELAAIATRTGRAVRG